MEFSLTEMGVIVFVALLLYGGRLPKVALAVGRAIGEFKKGLRETSDMVRYEIEESERSSRTLPATGSGSTADVKRDLQDDAPLELGYGTEDISLPESDDIEDATTKPGGVAAEPESPES